VIVNGQEVTIESKEDFNAVEHLLEESDDDDDVLEIIFPVTVILADHSEIVLANKDDLKNLKDQCTENGEDDDIECVDFKFPLTLSLYDTDNQVSEVITIRNDKELYKYMHELDEDEYCSITYPITVILSGGDEIVISNNDELENILKNAINACDEDDDNDFYHHDNSDLIDVLIEGKWTITYYFDEKDETGNFSGYELTFLENGTVKVSKDDNTIEGTWQTLTDDGKLKLGLDFGENEIMKDLNEDWIVVDIKESRIELKDISGGDGSVSNLVLEQK
jgi:hypothetical protein